jgi:DNA-directed RNA polymerase specialized sigma24 family protein
MAKDIISAYRNVCRDLQGLEAYLQVAHSRVKTAHRTMFKGKMPSSQMCYVPLDRAIEDYNSAADDYNETLQAVEQLRMAKEQMENAIGTMSDAEQVVILMHVEQGMNLREVAEKSNYTYGHLRNVSMMLRRKDMTESANVS